MVGFIGVVLFVHDYHGHPIICCQYNPGMVFFELIDGFYHLQADVGFGWGQFLFNNQLFSALNSSASLGESDASFYCCDVSLPWGALGNYYKVRSPGPKCFLCFGEEGGGQINDLFTASYVR